MNYETNKNTYNFQQFEPIVFFGDGVFNCKITVNEAVKKESNLRNNILEFNSRNSIVIVITK